MNSPRSQISSQQRRPTLSSDAEMAIQQEIKAGLPVDNELRKNITDTYLRRDDILWDMAQGGMKVTQATQRALDEAFANAMMMVYIDDFMSHQTIDEKAIKLQYEQYQKELGTVEYEFCLMTVARKSDAEAAIKEYAACRDFKEVARKHSTDSMAARGGYVGWACEGLLSESVRDALARLQPNQISAPLETPQGTLLVCFLASRKVVPMPLNDIRPQLEETIRAERLGRHLLNLRRRRETTATTIRSNSQPNPTK
ncbi:peptidylprolyl isomerase [Trinickia fusca]|uniref:peptidylprolyl isomerase n=1 Tax=Trinickia fusca TaxID=2419777 RepID=A0A494X8L8_9BURK|nr:peptidylprolyl isomerase [Trinickia fusca]RKP46908.1 hypothetical protein D7S89_16280 [Trinickia fusca]